MNEDGEILSRAIERKFSVSGRSRVNERRSNDKLIYFVEKKAKQGFLLVKTCGQY